jgi:hypothetical protein
LARPCLWSEPTPTCGTVYHAQSLERLEV